MAHALRGEEHVEWDNPYGVGMAGLIGWTAATGSVGPEPLILFLIVFLWTPPHFWALALNRRDEYARAGSRCCPWLPAEP